MDKETKKRIRVNPKYRAVFTSPIGKMKLQYDVRKWRMKNFELVPVADPN